MKIMFISDIHGIKSNLNKIDDKFNELNCDKLVVLGDLYYANSSIKKEDYYDANFVKEFLNKYKDKLICVRGNCDSEEEILTSKFSMEKEINKISTIDEDIYITHGHIYNESNWQETNSILVYGHLHQPFIKKIETNIYINPGSISLPRGDYEATYLIYNNGKFTIYDINDQIIYEKNK